MKKKSLRPYPVLFYLTCVKLAKHLARGHFVGNVKLLFNDACINPMKERKIPIGNFLKIKYFYLKSIQERSVYIRTYALAYR